MGKQKQFDKLDIPGVPEDYTLIDFYYTNQSSVCRCGHTPINNIAVIENIYTKESYEIGCICKRLFDKEHNYTATFEADTLLTSLRKFVRTDKLSAKFILWCRHINIINTWEYNFLNNTFRKKSLSEKQDHYTKEIKSKIRKYAEKKCSAEDSYEYVIYYKK